MLNALAFISLCLSVVLDIVGLRLGPVPLSAFIVTVAALLFLAGRRSSPLRLPWLFVAFLCWYAAGLIPLGRESLVGGIREIVQACVVFIVTVLAACSLGPARRRALHAAICAVGIVLVGYAVLIRLGVHGIMSDARLALLMCLSLPFITAPCAARCRGGRVLYVVVSAFAVGCANGGLLLCGLAGILGSGGMAAGLPGLKRTLLPVCLGTALFAAHPAAIGTLRSRHADVDHPKRGTLELQATPSAVTASPWYGHGLGRYKHAIARYFREFPLADDNRVVPDTNCTYALVAVEAGWPAATLLALALFACMGAGVRAVRGERRRDPALVAVDVLALAACFTVIPKGNTSILSGVVLGLALGGRRTQAGTWRPLVVQLCLLGVAVAVSMGMALLREQSGGVWARTGDSVARPRIISSGAAETWPLADYRVAEAEAPTAVPTGGMTVVGANGASGNRALAIPEGAGKGKGVAAYCMGVGAPGEYHLWLRVRWQDGCGNSIGVVANGARCIVSDETMERWHWVMAPRPVTSTDAHVRFDLHNLEDGVMVDQLLLTRDADVVPFGRMAGGDRGNG